MLSAATIALMGIHLLSAVSAVPAVTPISLNSYPEPSCSSWPRWINARPHDVTASLMFVVDSVDSADDDAINGLYAQTFNMAWGGSTRTALAIDLRKTSKIARDYYRCMEGQVNIMSGPEKVTISKDSNNAHLLVNDATGYTPEVYGHEIDGVRQDGVFLGAMGKTTWGFNLVQEEGCAGREGAYYYQAKLLGLPVDPDTPPTAGSPHHFEGFIKVIGWN